MGWKHYNHVIRSLIIGTIHEQHLGVHTSFLKEVKYLVAVIEEMGNPFVEQSQYLLVLDTRDNLDPSVGESVRKAAKLNEKKVPQLC